MELKGEFRIIFTKKIAYGDFLKKPKRFPTNSEKIVKFSNMFLMIKTLIKSYSLKYINPNVSKFK